MTMTEPHQSYIKLQRHLDKQAVGFAATKSGAEIRILQHMFSPAEAELATCLTYQPEPIEIIFQRAKHLVDSPAKLTEQLDRIQKKGGIESRIDPDEASCLKQGPVGQQIGVIPCINSAAFFKSVSQDQIIHLFFRQPDMFGRTGRAVAFFEFKHSQASVGF